LFFAIIFVLTAASTFQVWSQDISGGIVTGYGQDGPIPGKGKIFFCAPQLPGWLCGPLSLLSDSYRGIFLLE
jgi:hypothetical protein